MAKNYTHCDCETVSFLPSSISLHYTGNKPQALKDPIAHACRNVQENQPPTWSGIDDP